MRTRSLGKACGLYWLCRQSRAFGTPQRMTHIGGWSWYMETVYYSDRLRACCSNTMSSSAANILIHRTYHATMCGAQALLAHRFRGTPSCFSKSAVSTLHHQRCLIAGSLMCVGFGPGIPSVVPLLLQWADTDENKVRIPTHTRVTEWW